MNNEKKLSIIIPIYNGGRYLSTCLDSVVNQTIEEYEIICINDGSTDNSFDVLEEYKRKYPELIKVYHKENQGVWKAREFGISVATGEYIGFCDCDDIVDKSMYEKMYSSIIQSKADMVICAFVRVDDETGKVGKAEMNGWGNATLNMTEEKEQFALFNTAPWNKMIRRDIIQKHVKFDKPPRVAEDMMLLLSVYPSIKKVELIAEPLYYYYVRKNTAMTYFRLEEMNVFQQSMLITQQYVINNGGVVWEDVVELFVLIHMGLSVILRAEAKKSKECIKRVYNYLENHFQNWKRNKYLSIFKHKRLLKIYLIMLCYKTKLIYFIGRFNKLFLKMIGW